MRCWWLCLVFLLTGCTLDPRPKALRRGMDQVRSVLADPRLRSLADKSTKGALEERLVEALFSANGRGFWPPRLPAEYDFSSSDQSRLPGRIAYLRKPEFPWAVVVEPDAKAHCIRLLGYGMSVQTPLMRESVPVSGTP